MRGLLCILFLSFGLVLSTQAHTQNLFETKANLGFLGLENSMEYRLDGKSITEYADFKKSSIR